MTATAMQGVIDNHCHVSTRWYEPVETLLFQMDRHGVERAVLIQMLGSTDDSDMRDAQSRHPDRFGWVGMIDPAAPDWSDALHRAVDAGAAGLRMRAGWRTTGDDPLALWRAVAQSGLRVSLVGTVDSFTDGRLAEIIAACPHLPIVLEHLGGIARPDAGEREAAVAAVCALAGNPGLSLKLPGLGQLAPRLPSLDGVDQPIDTQAIDTPLDAVMASFCADRLLWGSDFPPVAAREGYGNALNWCRSYIAARWPQAVTPIFHTNSAHFWFGR